MDELKIQLTKLEDKLDIKLNGLDNRLDSIEKVQIRHDSNLENHMKRSDLLEKHTDKIFEDLEPIKKHVNKMEGLFQFIGVISTIIGIVTGLAGIVAVGYKVLAYLI